MGIALTVWMLVGCVAPGGGSSPVTSEDYEAAFALFESNLRGLVKNDSVRPHWLGDDGSFWYRRDTPEGHAYVRFDPATGDRTPLFDHEVLAAALGAVLAAHAELESAAELDAPPDADDLGLSDVSLDAEGHVLTAVTRAIDRSAPKRVTCDLRTMSCEVDDPPKPEPGLLRSPDESRAVFARADDLHVRYLDSGSEQRLTHDGAPFFSYGATPEGSLRTIPRKRHGTVLPPYGTAWSPDGRYLISLRIDEREVPITPFVEWVPQDGSHRPILHALRTSVAGDRDVVQAEAFVFEPAAGRQTAIVGPEEYGDGLGAYVLGWDLGRSLAYVLGSTFGSKKGALLRVDLATGAAEVVIEEADEARFETNTLLYNGPNIRVLGGGAEVVWYSTRTGWGHLYLYDAATGTLKNAITSGEWAVVDIVAIDEARREVVFTAVAREPGRDPYYRHLYRAELDGGGVTLLTDDDADHDFSPGRRSTSDPARRINLEAGVFLDTFSTVVDPPRTVLRSARDGHLIAEVERADATELYAAGWRPPVRERVKAADGVTDLYAVYFAPARDIGRDRHPVIDAVYGGPQVFVAPRNFPEACASQLPRLESSLARLGFAVVIVDGRGTPGRSRAFRDAGLPEFTRVGIEDHVAAIRQLAERHPEMDPDRVGVYGWSWGGTFSAQAILSQPEFYDVAVSGAGAYDYAGMYPGFESFTGIPVYSDGSRWRPAPDEAPANWAPLDITAMAPDLAGHLLIVYGDLDENVPPSQAFRLVDALIRAEKPYDLLYLPNRNHGGGSDPYTVRRTLDYFVEHLLGVVPPPAVAADS